MVRKTQSQATIILQRPAQHRKMDYEALLTIHWATRNWGTIEPRQLVCGLRADFSEEVALNPRSVKQVRVRWLRQGRSFLGRNTVTSKSWRWGHHDLLEKPKFSKWAEGRVESECFESQSWRTNSRQILKELSSHWTEWDIMLTPWEATGKFLSGTQPEQ